MRFFIEIVLPDDCETISYTTDPLEKCAAVATEFDGCSPLARLAGNDCSVYTVESLILQLKDERLIADERKYERWLSDKKIASQPLTTEEQYVLDDVRGLDLNHCRRCGVSIERWATHCEACGGEK